MLFNKCLVVDFGSQYNQLIVRRIRELGVYCELVDTKDILNKIDQNVKGIIFSGGPNSVYNSKSFSIPKQIYDLNIPILGICYGMQLIAHDLNGVVSESNKKEYGLAVLEVNGGVITKGLNKNEKV
jgi:GMP synthase (glutamine-hydrolysing)